MQLSRNDILKSLEFAILVAKRNVFYTRKTIPSKAKSRKESEEGAIERRSSCDASSIYTAYM